MVHVTVDAINRSFITIVFCSGADAVRFGLEDSLGDPGSEQHYHCTDAHFSTVAVLDGTADLHGRAYGTRLPAG